MFELEAVLQMSLIDIEKYRKVYTLSEEKHRRTCVILFLLAGKLN